MDNLKDSDTGDPSDLLTVRLTSLDELLGTLIDLVASGKIRLGVGLTQRLTGAREDVATVLAAIDEDLYDDAG